MNILVVSDSHTIDVELEALLAHYRHKVDKIIHCGDSELSHEALVWHLTDSVVKGNMDFGFDFVNDNIVHAGDEKIFVTHGHLYGVNFTRETLASQAKKQGCHIAFYGHTHILAVEKINDVICINPGSFNHSRGPVKERTYALVTLDGKKVIVRYYKANRTPLHELDVTMTL